VFPSSCAPFPRGEGGILTGVDGTWFSAWISGPPVLPRMTGVPGDRVCARVAGPLLLLSVNSRGGLSRVGRGWCLEDGGFPRGGTETVIHRERLLLMKSLVVGSSTGLERAEEESAPIQSKDRALAPPRTA